MATDSTASSKPTQVNVLQTTKKTVRVPSVTGKGTQTVKTSNTSVSTRSILYPSPTTDAQNQLAKTLEGPALTALQQQLYEAGYYDANDQIFYGRRRPEDAKALARAMEEANMRGETYGSAANFRISMNIAGITKAGAATGSGSGSGAAKPAGSLQLTGPNTARAAYDQLSLKYTGTKGADFQDAYQKLVAAQTAAPVKYATQKINGKLYSVQISDSVDANDFLEQYILNKVNFGSDEIGGIAATNLSAVKEASKAYGTALSNNELAQFAKGLTDGSMTDNDIRKKLSERAKMKYKAFANDINETVSVYDLASDFINAKANTLELSSKSLGVDDVADAISGDKPMTTSEYVTQLKKDPRYQYTNQARTNAASFATNLATTFGFGV